MENILTNELVEKRDAILNANADVLEYIREHWATYATTYNKLKQMSAKELLALANEEDDPIKKVLCAKAMKEAQPKGPELEKE